MMNEYNIILPRPHDAQAKIQSSLTRFNVVNCGRRFGKTSLGIDMATRTLFPLSGQPQRVGYFTPIYKYVAEVWRDIKTILHSVIAKKYEQEKRIEFINGSVFELWSLEDPNAGRSRAYHRVIIDEAAMARHLEVAWNEAIRPTLSDYEGDALFFSTPKGLNYFHTLYSKDAEFWYSWHYPTSANPHIPSGEIAVAQRELPENVFRQEYLAEFLEDGAFFQNIEAVCTLEPRSFYRPANFVMGIDWGKLDDFTVVSIFDVRQRKMVRMGRFNQIDYNTQAHAVKTLYDAYKPSIVLAESNAMGEAIIDSLRAMGIPVRGFQTTQLSKHRIINQLSLALQQQSIALLDDTALKTELRAYQAERLPSGMLRYGAPPGMHDDCVMSLAIVLEASTMTSAMLQPAGIEDPYA